MKTKQDVIHQDIIKTKIFLIKKEKVPEDFTSSQGNIFQWIWLPSSNVMELLNIRNKEHVLSNMRNSLPLTKEMHMDFLYKYNSLHRFDFVLLNKDNGDYVGGINITLTDYGFEIGKYIGNENYLGQGISYLMSESFISFVKENIKEIKKIIAVTKQDNFININLNFKLGFKIVQPIEQNYWLMEMK